MACGFHPNELKPRYDVHDIEEDSWHTYSGQKTAEFIDRHLLPDRDGSRWLLNAGAGIYQLNRPQWNEVALDLFTTPMRGRPRAVAATVERLPFASGVFGAIVCVGEVLAYCDPAVAIAEFGRTLQRSGLLILDFRSSRSIRRWCCKGYGRAADLVDDEYNNTPEKTWVYDVSYMKSLLFSNGFRITKLAGFHTWSAAARKLGMRTSLALTTERYLHKLRFPRAWADLITVAARHVENVR